MYIYRDSEKGRTDRVRTDDYLYVCSAGLNAYRTADYTVLRPTGREDYHIIYPIEGALYAMVGDEEVCLHRGDFVLYRPGEPQRYTVYAARQNAYYWVHFKGVGVEALLRDTPLEKGRVFRGAEGAEIGAAFSELVQEYGLKRPNFRRFSAALLASLLCRLSRTQEEGGGADGGRRQDIYRIAAEINRLPAADKSVEEYAAEIGLGRDRFAHLFRQVMGMSPHRYRQAALLSSARRMLRESSLTVAEVALSLGFEDPLYFSRLFRRACGVSPRAYREGAREKADDTTPKSE